MVSVCTQGRFSCSFNCETKQGGGLVRFTVSVTQNHVLQLVNQALAFLGLIGVIVDPTTAGLGDSDRPPLRRLKLRKDSVNK